MANGYNPYNIVGTQQALLENLLASEQAQKVGQAKIGEQKGKMTKEFEEELIAAQKKQEEELAKSRKGKLWEKLLPIASMFGGPLASGILGGLQGMYDMKKQQKFEREKIGAARGMGIDEGRWGGTFLGSQARKFSGERESMFDNLLREQELSDWDIGLKGITGGIKGWASGKMGENIKEGIRASKMAPSLKDVDLTKATEEKITELGAGKKFGGTSLFKGKTADFTREELMRIQDVLGDAKRPGIKAMFGEMGLGKDPTMLLEEGGTGSNLLKNLLLLLTQMEGDR